MRADVAGGGGSQRAGGVRQSAGSDQDGTIWANRRIGDRWGSGIGSKINPKNSAAFEQSFDRRLIASTVTDAIGEIGDRVHGSRGIEIVIQSGAYLRNVWSRISPRPASYGRAESDN